MIIDTKDFNFLGDVSRRVQIMNKMHQYIIRYKPNEYTPQWAKTIGLGCTPEETNNLQREIAEDYTKFVKALYEFYVHICWDEPF